MSTHPTPEALKQAVQEWVQAPGRQLFSLQNAMDAAGVGPERAAEVRRAVDEVAEPWCDARVRFSADNAPAGLVNTKPWIQP